MQQASNEWSSLCKEKEVLAEYVMMKWHEECRAADRARQELKQLLHAVRGMLPQVSQKRKSVEDCSGKLELKQYKVWLPPYCAVIIFKSQVYSWEWGWTIFAQPAKLHAAFAPGHLRIALNVKIRLQWIWHPVLVKGAAMLIQTMFLVVTVTLAMTIVFGWIPCQQ